MNSKKIKNRNIVLFKRWQNKGFSILSTIGKIVIVLTLPFIYLTLSFNLAFSQNDTIVDLLGVMINSQRRTVFTHQNSVLVNIISNEQIKKMPASTLSDLLKGSLGVDLQQRGTDDIQADISIRGGNFDQNLILLNGVPISDPQTGHNSFSIPVPLEMIRKIEIIQGPGTRIYGLGAYSGAINIVTKSPEKLQLMLNAETGENNFLTGNVYIGSPIGKNSIFGYSASYNSSNGYTTNTDYKSISQFLNLICRKKYFRISNQVSFNAKQYGAYNFYTPNFPFQYEIIGKLRASTSIEIGQNYKNKINVYFNLGTDEFQLFRESEEWYQHIDNYWIKNGTDTAKYAQNIYQSWAYYSGHNYHLTNTIGSSFNSEFNSFFGNTSYGFNIERNQIKSTVLGEEIDPVDWLGKTYSKGDTRINYNIFADQSKTFGKVDVSFGTNLIYNEKFGLFTTFGGDINYKISSPNRIYLSINQGVRMPTFTDLYYNGPSNIGNIDLKPEKATTYEIGYKYFGKNIQILSAIFYRKGKNTIDWVKESETEKWQTMNYTEVNTKGFEFALNKNFNSRIIDLFNINYTYLYQDKPQGNYISKYTLNYLRHNLSFSANHEIIKNLNLNWRARYSFRNGTYFYQDESTSNILETNFNGTWLIDAKLSFKLKNFSIYVQVSNILNTEYYDLSYIKLPGRSIKGGVKFNL
ncbi:MAG: TonB-dependent receptor [Bacteroidales bacterium]|nr:TonB-dependent receptor [Bacteroidales bacterium]